MQRLYKHPQVAFPYQELLDENGRRSRAEPEFELADMGVFDDGRYFDILGTYAKASPEDLCSVIEVTNHGDQPATIHILPTLWFRNTRSWGGDDRQPEIRSDGTSTNRFVADHGLLGRRWLTASSTPVEPRLLFCESETNHQRIDGSPTSGACPKDGINVGRRLSRDWFRPGHRGSPS
jgi:hypothetical protein